MTSTVFLGNNGVQATATISFVNAGITPQNCTQIIKVSTPYDTYDPLYPNTNGFDGFVENEFYTLVMKQPLDLSAYTRSRVNPDGQEGESQLVALAPPVLTLAAQSQTEVLASWTPVTGAVSYRLMQYIFNSWQIIQNTLATSKTISGLAAETLYNFRVQAVGNKTTTDDSVFDTENVTTFSPLFTFFNATFSAGAGSLSGYTPETGTLISTLGTANLDGAGNLNMQPSSSNAYSVIEVGGTKPLNRKATIVVTSIDTSSDVEIALKSNSGGTLYTFAQLVKLSPTTGTFAIQNEAGILATTSLSGMTYPLTMSFTIVGTSLTAQINNLTPITATDTNAAQPNVVKIQTVDGAVISSLLVEGQ